MRRYRRRRKEKLIEKWQDIREHILNGFSVSIIELKVVIRVIPQPMINAILKNRVLVIIVYHASN